MALFYYSSIFVCYQPTFLIFGTYTQWETFGFRI